MVIKPPATAGGYAKPGQSQARAVDPAKAARAANTKASTPIGSKFDEQLVQRMQRQRAAESLKVYQGEQQRFKQPVAPPSQGQVAGNPVYQKAQTYSKFDYGNYYTRRDNYYGNDRVVPPRLCVQIQPQFWGLGRLDVVDDSGSRREIANIPVRPTITPTIRATGNGARKRTGWPKTTRSSKRNWPSWTPRLNSRSPKGWPGTRPTCRRGCPRR